MQSISNNMNKCRCCLKKGKHPHNINEECIKMFKERLNILLSNESRLPQLMCSGCKDSLKEASKFRDKVMATDRQLLEELKNGIKNNDILLNRELDEETSDMEAESDGYRDDDLFQASDIMSSFDVAEAGKNKNDIKEYTSVTIGSTVVKRRITRQSARASDEAKMAVSAAPCKRKLETSFTKPVRKREKNNPPVQLSEISNSTLLTDVKEENNQELKNNEEKVHKIQKNPKLNVRQDKNIQKLKEIDDKKEKNAGPVICNISSSISLQAVLEPKIPKSLVINSSVIQSEPILTEYDKIRKNIIQTLKYSTIVPFQCNIRKGSFGCYYCKYEYKTMNELRKHTDSQHPNVTDKELMSFMRIRCHKYVHADISLIKCKLCGEQQKMVEHFIEHLTNAHGKVYNETDVRAQGIFGVDLSTDVPTCHICGEKFERFVKLSEHLNVHYADFVCNICNKTFATEIRHKEHMKGHSRIRKCEHCDATFRSIAGYKYHVEKTHFKNIPYCRKCNKTFKDYTLRGEHMRKIHGETIRQDRQCDTCKNGQLYTQSDLTKHRKIHRKPRVKRLLTKRFICDICGYKNAYKSILVQHINYHYGIKTFKCEVCEKGFSWKATLTSHMQKHSVEKKYVCNVCGQAFAQSYSFRYHMKAKHSKGTKD